MSCALPSRPPSADLTQSQFLWPQLSTPLHVGASSTRVWRDHNRRAFTEKEVVYSDSFRKGLLFIAGQVICELNKSSRFHAGNNVPPAPYKNGPCSTSVSYNNTYRSTVVYRSSYSPISTRHSSQLTEKQSRTSSSRATSSSPARRKGLRAPRPRLSSPLSPNAPGTLLPAPTERRPMPSTRKKDERLYKLVLEKSVLRISDVTTEPKPPATFNIKPILPVKLLDNDVGGIHGRCDASCDISKINPKSHLNDGCTNGELGELSDSWVVVAPQSTWDVVSLEELTF